jgi:hypothetical protein
MCGQDHSVPQSIERRQVWCVWQPLDPCPGQAVPQRHPRRPDLCWLFDSSIRIPGKDCASIICAAIALVDQDAHLSRVTLRHPHPHPYLGLPLVHDRVIQSQAKVGGQRRLIGCDAHRDHVAGLFFRHRQHSTNRFNPVTEPLPAVLGGFVSRNPHFVKLRQQRIKRDHRWQDRQTPGISPSRFVMTSTADLAINRATMIAFICALWYIVSVDWRGSCHSHLGRVTTSLQPLLTTNASQLSEF